jgi:hypothetical protein
MKTNTKLTLLAALTLAVLPTVALASVPEVNREEATTALHHVATIHDKGTPHFMTGAPALRFNLIDGQPLR